MKNVIIVIVLIILIGWGIAAFNSPEEASDAMMDNSNDSAMMDDDGSMTDDGEAMMEEDGDSMMEDDSMMEGEGDSMMEDGDAMVKSEGSYEDYSPEKLERANDGKVVLFFKASWCPSCNALDKDINANLGNIPEGVTILKVDYDNSQELKKKYGVTLQHTFVQVDAEGNQIAKWGSSPTLATVLEQIK